MKIYIECHGCSRRKAEVAKMHSYFKQNGYEIINRPESVDYILIATCAFKKEEEDYSLARIKILRRYKAKLVVYGCLPEIAPSRFNLLPRLDWISPKNIESIDEHFDNISVKFADVSDAHLIPATIKYSSLQNALNKLISNFDISKDLVSRSIGYANNRVKNTIKSDNRFYLSISRGCLGKCTYCAIRHAVGNLRSKPSEIILAEFDEGLTVGYKDIVILGDDVGAYGMDSGTDFPSLLSALLSRSGSSVRLHIEEIHPKWLLLYKDRLTGLLSSGRFRSLLCPIQSGDNRILLLMQREHDSEGLIRTLNDIRESYPKLKLTTQIIAGFPSEEEHEFDNTLEFVKKARFDAVTIFPYDEKENTPASAIGPKVPEYVIKLRVRRAQEYFDRNNIEALLSCPK